MPRPAQVTLVLGCCLTAAGAALGALARWGIEGALPVADGEFPWATFLINVSGALALAALPLLPAARRHAGVGVLLGTGVLGGYTTMSTFSVEAVDLLRGGHVALGAAYTLGTLGAALLGVLAVDRLTTIAERRAAEDEGWDE